MLFQVKYKEEGKKQASTSLYSQLPETAEIQFAKQMSEMQSEVGNADPYSLLLTIKQLSFHSSNHFTPLGIFLACFSIIS